MSTLIEKLEQEVNRLLELKAQEKPHSLRYVFLGHHIAATVNAINIVRQHSDWIDVSVEPIKRTEFDSEAVLAVDVNGYTYNVTLADVVICGEKNANGRNVKLSGMANFGKQLNIYANLKNWLLTSIFQAHQARCSHEAI